MFHSTFEQDNIKTLTMPGRIWSIHRPADENEVLVIWRDKEEKTSGLVKVNLGKGNISWEMPMDSEKWHWGFHQISTHFVVIGFYSNASLPIVDSLEVFALKDGKFIWSGNKGDFLGFNEDEILVLDGQGGKFTITDERERIPEELGEGFSSGMDFEEGKTHFAEISAPGSKAYESLMEKELSTELFDFVGEVGFLWKDLHKFASFFVPSPNGEGFMQILEYFYRNQLHSRIILADGLEHAVKPEFFVNDHFLVSLKDRNSILVLSLETRLNPYQ